MWNIAAFVFVFSIDFVTPNVDYLQHPVKSCHIGDVVENECNKCMCTSKTVFECTPTDCNKNKSQKEIEPSMQLCFPNQLYVQNLITCICTKDGRWPHKSCQDTFLSLPPSNVVKHKCSPDTYVNIDCNVCRCGPDGEVIGDRCTRNACEDDSQRRINLGPNSVYSSCEIKNWYSLAPCQFCFCVNQNKLVCNTGNYYSKKLELGSYNLRVCGKDLIREAIELIPDNQRMLRFGSGSNASVAATIKQIVITTKATTKTIAVPSETVAQHSVNYAFDVNREDHESSNRSKARPQPKVAKEEENSSYDKEEYYTETEEETPRQAVHGPNQKLPHSLVAFAAVTTTVAPETKPTQPIEQEARGASTKFPFEEGDEMLNESQMENTDEDNEEDSNEIVVDMYPSSPTASTPKADMNINLHAGPDQTQQQASVDLQHQMAREGKSGESYQYVGNTLKINLPKVLNKVFQLALRKSMVSLSNETKCVPGTTTVNNCNMCFCLKNSKMLCTNNKCKDQAQ